MRTPISEHHRLSSIDTLRGFALLGILVMNIRSFAMISAAYTFPNLHMDISGVNLVIWTLSHVFADLKFMAIFYHAVWRRGYFGNTATGSGGAAHMDLSLCTHVLVADLWDDPRLFYLVRGHIGHLCAVRICGLLVSQSLCPRTLFHRMHFPVDCAVDYDVSGCRARDVQQGILEDFVPTILQKLTVKSPPIAGHGQMFKTPA